MGERERERERREKWGNLGFREGDKKRRRRNGDEMRGEEYHGKRVHRTLWRVSKGIAKDKIEEQEEGSGEKREGRCQEELSLGPYKKRRESLLHINTYEHERIATENIFIRPS